MRSLIPTLQEAAAGGFWSYAAGTAYRLLVDFGVGGLCIDNYRCALSMQGCLGQWVEAVVGGRQALQAYGVALAGDPAEQAGGPPRLVCHQACPCLPPFPACAGPRCR